MKRAHVPRQIQCYVEKFYDNLESQVVTKNYKSCLFSFKRGVMTGDPMSPICFLLAFQPILSFLKNEEEKYGYDLEGNKTISLPYADDFCLATPNMRTQQRLINEIEKKILSMGMLLKPSKCRSHSITSGKSSDISFKINTNTIPTIKNKEQKFLGKKIFFTAKTKDTLEYLTSEFREKLINLDESLVRNEFKIWIYKNYFLHSIRFLLTVHELPPSSLQKLDAMATKFLKT